MVNESYYKFRFVTFQLLSKKVMDILHLYFCKRYDVYRTLVMVNSRFQLGNVSEPVFTVLSYKWMLRSDIRSLKINCRET